MSKPKGINKSKVGFSIDKETYAEFEHYCELRNINKSKLVDKILKRFLEEKKSETPTNFYKKEENNETKNNQTIHTVKLC
jgi:hypothetical protein